MAQIAEMIGLFPSGRIMTAPLKLSVNEFSSLLRQVCKATYTAYHDYITIREAVLWLEVQGFDGLGALLGDFTEERQCPRREGFHQSPMSWPLAGESLLPISHMAGDLLLAESHDRSSFSMQIKDAKNPSALLSELVRLSGAGLTAQLFLDGTLFAECGAGELNIFKSPKDWPTLVKTISFDIKDIKALSETAVISMDKINSRMKQAYDEGVSVNADTYALLNTRAALCLVPSTEESRKGAGE